MTGDKVIEALVASDEVDRVARYLSRGRHLQSLDEPTLRQLWLGQIRQHLRDGSGLDASTEDVSAELALRGISTVELPPDLKVAIKTGAVSTLERDAKFRDYLLNEMIKFMRTLSKPMN